MVPLIWLGAGVLLVAAELVSGDFVLLMLGTAALATAGASGLGVPLGPDVAAFALVAAALVLLVRPTVKRRLHAAQVNTGTQALLGARAEVLETVDGHGGTVRLRGSEWSARPLHDDAVLAPGLEVVVVGIEGATAVVTAESGVG